MRKAAAQRFRWSCPFLGLVLAVAGCASAGPATDTDSSSSAPGSSTGASFDSTAADSTAADSTAAASTAADSAATGSSSASAGEQSPLVVNTTTGTVRGIQVGSTRQFLGIRYAMAPTGDRRWQLPVPVTDTDDVVNADTPGSPCPQKADVALGLNSTDEDCLFLNVTTPARDGDTRRPVMVWWHGGGFTSGAGSQYDTQRMADEGDVIVVTANYRLGMLGYLGLPGLEGSGNFGLADQFEALRWANDNAEAFGGNPDDVTVFGESAGGISVCAALTSPEAKGLVDRAVFSSGTCRLAWPAGTLFPGLPATSPLIPLQDSEALGMTAAQALGCAGPDTLTCLRALPVDALVGQAALFGNPLAYGTALLPEQPSAAIESGRVLDVPVISGGNRDEHRSFVGGLLLTDPNAVSANNYPALLEASFGAGAGAVAEHYPLTSFESAPIAWSTLITDAAWACTTTHGARDLAAAGLPVWSYEFADRTAPDVSNVGSSGLPQGAAHATDLPYLFDLGGKNLVNGPGQPQLSDTMIALWTSFARSGTPTAAAVAEWPATTATEASVLQLDNPAVSLVDHRAEHQCAFWESLGLG